MIERHTHCAHWLIKPHCLIALIFLLALLFNTNLAGANNKVISPSIFKVLQTSNSLIADASYTQAISAIKNTLSEQKNLSAFEEAQLYKMQAQAYLSIPEYKNALAALHSAINTKALNKKENSTMWFQAGQIHLHLEENRAAAEAIQTSIKLSDDTEQKHYLLLAHALSVDQKTNAAIQAVEQARKIAPLEKQYVLLLIGLYADSERYADAARLLERHITENKLEDFSLWKQLSSFYERSKQHQRAVAIITLAQQQKIIQKERDWIYGARLLIRHQHAYKAAKMLERSIANGSLSKTEKHYRLLGDAWTAAREWDLAMENLERAAKLSNNGNLYVRLAQIAIEKEDWTSGLEYLQSAFAIGQLDRPGYAHLLRGICAIESGSLSLARQAFTQSQRFSETRKDANRWLDFLAQQEKVSS